jgi:hypothetical protein
MSTVHTRRKLITEAGKQNDPQSKSEYNNLHNNWHETHQTAFDFVEGGIGKLNRYKDRNICKMLAINEIVETSVTSTCLLVACLDLK